MSTLDGGLYDILRENMRYAHLQRIESSLTGLGIPDINVCHGGREAWIEAKQTDGWKPKIRGAQVGWAETRVRYGGHVILMTRRHCRAGVRRAAADELWIHWGGDIRKVYTEGLTAAEPMVPPMPGGPAKWDWEVVRNVVFNLA